MPSLGPPTNTHRGGGGPQSEAERERGPRLFLTIFLLLQFFLLVYILVIVRLSGFEALVVLIASMAGLAVGLYYLAKQIAQRF